MADDTGGKYYYVEDAKDLAPAFRQDVGRPADAVRAGVLCAGEDGTRERARMGSGQIKVEADGSGR